MRGAQLIVDCTGVVTTAAIIDSGGTLRPMLFDGSPYLASGVYLGGDGTLLTGRRGADAALADPDRYVTAPVQLLGSASVLDGTDPAELVAVVLRAVHDQASQLDGRLWA